MNLGENLRIPEITVSDPEPLDPPPEIPRFNAASLTFISFPGQTSQIGDSRHQNDLLGYYPGHPLKKHHFY